MLGPGLGAEGRRVLGGLVDGWTGGEGDDLGAGGVRGLGEPGWGAMSPEERTASRVLEVMPGSLRLEVPSNRGNGCAKVGVQPGTCTTGDSGCAGHRERPWASVGLHPAALAGARVSIDHRALSGERQAQVWILVRPHPLTGGEGISGASSGWRRESRRGCWRWLGWRCGLPGLRWRLWVELSGNI